ncbi:hypothetical protein [Sporosarcina psychrophila]|uniref:Uncharacterized protein n=1 Tax=Sporosarcina psychrophila TaxID=1476 RepID=A0ABV2KAN9_SPOPS
MGNSEMQIIRWGIPGWITVFTYSVLVLSINDYDIYRYANENNLNGVYLAGLAGLFVAAGVPLGYLVYQIYFSFKWRFMENDKISKALEGLKLFDDLQLKENPRNDWKKAELAFDAYLTIFLPEEVNYDDVMRRYNSLKSRTDRVHGLGATIWGISLSYIGFIVVHVFIYQIPVYLNIIFIVSSLLLLGLWLILLKNYKNSNDDSFDQMKGIMYDIEYRWRNKKK